DAADYTVWRDHLATGEPLPNDPTPGSVSQDDYQVWRSNYGATFAADAGTLTRIATGTPADFGGQVITGLLDQTSDGLAASYYLRVLGDDAAYSLVVTRDAAFGSRATPVAGDAQDISGPGAVFGHLESAQNNRLFAFDATADVIRELDPQTGAELNAFPTPVAATSSPDFGLATTPTSLLVGGISTGDIFELDVDTGAVLRTFDNPGVNVSGIAFLSNLILLLDDVQSTLTVLDYRTGNVLRSVPVSNVFESLASDGQGLYGTAGDQLFRISPITGATFLVGSLSNTLSAVEGLGFLGNELYAADFDKIDVYQHPSLTYSRSLQGLNNLEAIGADNPGQVVLSDVFSLSVVSGDQLQLTATAPASGSGEFLNQVRLKLELFDPEGVLVATGSNPGIDPNATISHAAQATGRYTVRVSSELGEGEYLLEATGATGNQPPFRVATAQPSGVTLTDSPSFIEIRFSDSIDLTSLDAGDLLIDGSPASEIQELVDGRTVRFDTPLLAHGPHVIEIEGGSIQDLRGEPVEAYAGSFEIDAIGPQVVYSSITEGQLVHVEEHPGQLEVVIGFDESLDENLLDAFGVLNNVVLQGQRSGAYNAIGFEYDAATFTLQLSFAGLVEDRYTLTLLSNDGLFVDVFGNPLDGEPSPLTTVPSGDGVRGGDFFVHFELDSPTHAPVEFVRLEPLGGLASVSQNTRRLNSAADIDAYSIFAQEGETLTAIITPDNPAVTLRAQLIGQSAEVIAPAPGAPLVVPISALSAEGDYTLRVRGDGVTDYSTAIYRNTAVEAAIGDSGEGHALSLDSSFLPLGAGRYAVVGSSEDNLVDRVVWAVQPATGLILRVDPATGQVLGGFAAPGDLLPSHTHIGLSIAEFGHALLYLNADDDPTSIYRLNPSTGAVLSVESVHSVAADGLAYNSHRAPFTELVVNGGFETGDFTGWTATTNGRQDFTPWTVAGDGQGFFGSSAPLSGEFSALNGFVGETGLEYQLYQDVTIPAGVSAVLTTNHRIQYDSLGSTTLIDRDLVITIRDQQNHVLETLYTESILTDSGEPYTDRGWNHLTFDVSAYAGQTVRIQFDEIVSDFFVAPSLIQFDDISLQASSVGTEEAVFLSHSGVDLHRQAGYSGGETTSWATGSPVGALGGDDAIRQFGYFTDGLIHEYAPDVDDNAFLSSLPSPAPDLEGMAFDGSTLYVAPRAGGIIELDPDDGAVRQTHAIAGGAIYGLGALQASGAGIITPNYDEYEITLHAGPTAIYDFVLAGQDGVDFSGGLIEVLNSEGEVVAASSAGPLGVDAENFDQAIFGFSPNTDGVYTIRLTLDAVGQYGLVVTDSLVFDAEPNDPAIDGQALLRSISDSTPALGYLAAGDSLAQLFPLVKFWPFADAGSDQPAVNASRTQTATAADTAYLPLGVSREDLARKLAPRAPRLAASLGGAATLIVSGESEPNDSLATADALPLGFDAGEDPAVDVAGTLASQSDVDVFRVQLQPGDILGANLGGGAFELALVDAAGAVLMGSAQDLTGIHPFSSPLPGGGNAALSWVVDTAGDYYVAVGSGIGAYNLNLRVFRPTLEQQEYGAHQTLFIDFDGATLDTSIFGGAGVATLSGLDAYLPGWGLTTADRNAVIDAILASIEESLSADIRAQGLNGDFDDTALPGQFDIEILNSRDHADPFGSPNVSRVIVGGSIAQLGISTIGIAESIDVGNFETEESAVVLLDLLSSPAPNPNSLNGFARAAGVSL
ncbi:MAG: hypothetical protein KDA37_15375, partial [Planctomycetales bacterium]|nr:hypothetical protein [Planctomycetales bacterium]